MQVIAKIIQYNCNLFPVYLWKYFTLIDYTNSAYYFSSTYTY